MFIFYKPVMCASNPQTSKKKNTTTHINSVNMIKNRKQCGFLEISKDVYFRNEKKTR